MGVRLLLCNAILTILVNFGSTELVGTCPKVNEADVTFLTDSEDCSIFYKCSWGVAYKYDCPENLYFNPSLNVCDYPEQTECGSTGANIGESTEGEGHDLIEQTTDAIGGNGEDDAVGECPAENTEYDVHLPHASDCALFYICSWGVPVLQKCDDGLHFNPYLGVCDWPDSAGCESDTGNVDDDNVSEDGDVDEGSGGDEDIDEDSGETEDVDEGSGEGEEEDGNIDSQYVVVAECPSENGEYAIHLPHETDCTLFYTCNWGVPILQECPDGLHFNPSLEVCDWPNSAGCGSGTENVDGDDESEDVDLDEDSEYEVTEDGIDEAEDGDEGIGEDEDVAEDIDEGGDNENIVPAECPAENGEYAVHLPHESNCSLFYTCNWGVPILQECPDGLHFNPSLEVCDRPDSAGCGSGTENVDGDDESENGDLDEVSGESEDIEEGSDEAVDADGGSSEDEDEEEDINEGDDNGNVVSVECPAENGVYAVHLPHESNCSLFYTCNWGVPILQECPDGLHFNPSLEVCDRPDSAGCGSGTENVDGDDESENGDLDEVSGESEDIEEGSDEAVAVDEGSGEDEDEEEDINEGDDNGNVVPSECPVENGEYAVHLPHESNCSLFYSCNWGVPILQECPDGLHFNPSQEVCDRPDSAGCGSGAENVDGEDEAEDGDLDEISGESEDIEEGSDEAMDADEGSGDDEDEEEDIDEGDDNGNVVPAECPVENGEYAVHLPHESNCSLFYTCNWGVPILQECPDGLHFNPSLEVCDRPDSAGCGSGAENVDGEDEAEDGDLDEISGESEDIEEGSDEAMDADEGSGEDEDVEEDIDEGDDNGNVFPAECPVENGEYAVHLPHESNCSLFYTCNWGVPILQECPDGLHFNPSLAVCDWPDSVGCDSGTENIDGGDESEDGNLDEGNGENEETEDGGGEAENADEGIGEDEDIAEDIDEGDDNENVVPAECPAENGEYAVHLPHESNCTLFYTCNWGVPVLQECPDGLYFNPLLEVCDWPNSAGCQSEAENSEEVDVDGDDDEMNSDNEQEDLQLTSSASAYDESAENSSEGSEVDNNPVGECPAENDENMVFLPHPSNCSLFYECDWGEPVLQQCPGDLHFSPTLQVCDYPEEAGCEMVENGNGDESTDDDEESTENEQEGLQISNGASTYDESAENSSEGSEVDNNPVGECPAENDENMVFLPHASNCSLFYECDWGESVLQQCPGDLHFSPTLQVCDYPEEAGCEMVENGSGDESADDDEESTENEQQGLQITNGYDNENGTELCYNTICLIGSDEFIPNTSDCTKFCKCSRGQAYKFSCPAGLYFNPILKVCDYPEKSGCIA